MNVLLAQFNGVRELVSSHAKTGRDTASRQSHTRISRPIVEMDGVSIRCDGLAAWENDIADVSSSLIGSFRAKHPRISAKQTHLWLIEIKSARPNL